MFVGCGLCFGGGAGGLLAGDAKSWYKHVL